jgi:hypothetical protein
MYYLATQEGFIGEKKPTKNVRWARNFPTFHEAKRFAEYVGLRYYAVLTTIIQETHNAE